MGLLEELIILVKDTIEDASERRRQAPLPGAPQRSAEEIEVLRRSLARRAAEQQAEEQQTAERAAHEQHAQQTRQRQVHERERHHQKQVKAVHSAQVTRHIGAVDPRRVVRLLHQPHTLRELIVLKELLDKPLALRRR